MFPEFIKFSSFFNSTLKKRLRVAKTAFNINTSYLFKCPTRNLSVSKFIFGMSSKMFPISSEFILSEDEMIQC